MSGESVWVKNFFDCQFPLLKRDVKLNEAKQILEQHKPTKLFKYRQADSRGFEVIETGNLWLAKADTVNDEYDCFYAYSIEDILDDHEQTLRESVPDVEDSTIQQLRESHRLRIQAEHDNLRTAFRQSIKLCSLSQRLDIPKMWEEYSGNHSGFCIEFDLRRVPPELWEMLLPIFYTDNMVDFSAYNAGVRRSKGNINRSYIRRAALTKALKWEEEQEWRIIYPDEPEKPGVNCSGIPISCVYLGYKASQHTADQVTAICQSKGIPVKTMKFANGLLII
jgi:hypothetical protein